MKTLKHKLFKLKGLGSILAESHPLEHKLKKVLGPFELILLGGRCYYRRRYQGGRGDSVLLNPIIPLLTV
jgi:hypothetical protein